MPCRSRVTNALLGGSFNSRITANIREQKGYTYSPRSEISRRYHDAYWAESRGRHHEIHRRFAEGNLRRD